MADNAHCLERAKIGDVATVCLTPLSFDDEGRRQWRPSRVLTNYKFSFPIIGTSFGNDISFDAGTRCGFPIIGVPLEDKTHYGFTPADTYGRYGSTYILIPSDIKTVNILKAR